MKLFEALNQQFSEFRQGIAKMLWGTSKYMPNDRLLLYVPKLI
jgi:hypothetical protein